MPALLQRSPLRTALAVGLLALSLVHFAVGAWRSQAAGIADFPIFINEAEAFLDSGVLYPYVDQPELYAPAAPVYKFPPLFATLLLPFARAPRGAVYLGHCLLQLAIYGAAGAWLIAGLRGRRTIVVRLAAVVLWLNAEPFFETLWRLQLETYIVLALVAALAALRGNDDGRAGFAIGVAATLKVYPALILGWWIVARRWLGLAGALAAGLMLSLGTLLVIGIDDHLRWAFGVLPPMLGELPFDDVENVSLAASSIRLFGLTPESASVVQRVVALPALLAAAWLAATRAGPGADAVARRLALGLFVTTTLLAMSNAWGNYQLLLVVPIVLVLEDAVSRRARLPAALVVVASITLLFAIPCPREMIGQWPCSETPPWLGLVPLPRGLHDTLAATRVLAIPLVWVAGALALARPDPARISRAASSAD